MSNNSNDLLLAIEDELIKSLEKLDLPSSFVVWLDDKQFFEILRRGIYMRGKKMDLGTTQFILVVDKHRIIVRSELYRDTTQH